MAPALTSLIRGRRFDRKTIEKFIGSNSFPIQEGRTSTFVYYGRAQQVRLRHWIYGLESAQEFSRVPRSRLWYLTLDLPDRSRIEYKLEITAADKTVLSKDPLNPLEARDPFGANSVCHGAGYETPQWALEDPEARQGELEEFKFQSRNLGRDQSVTVYTPARLRPNRRYPLLVVHDGDDFLRYARFRTVLDNLIHRLEIDSMIVALTQSSNRLDEYTGTRSHADFLCDELLPEMATRYPLIDRPEARGLLGASFGAVAALSCTWHRPGVFDKLLLLSGSFAFTDIGESRRGPVFDPVVDFMNKFRREPGNPAGSIYLSCGIYESLIYENRSLLPLLQDTDATVRYFEARDGHNWENWRDRMREALSFLLPGPLWMVYE